MKQLRQNGFTAIEAVLILVVIGIIGFTGWFVWHAKQNTDKTLTDTANSQPAIQKKAAAKPSTSTTSSQTDTQKYLDIKEWGVKVPLSTQITTATYAINSGNSNDATLGIPALVGKCTIDDPFGYYMRFTSKDTFEDGTTYVSQLGAKATKIGDYYYIHQGPQAQCSDDATIQSQVQADVNAFIAATTDMKAD